LQFIVKNVMEKPVYTLLKCQLNFDEL
jgi:hypothetical protein